ncbi:MAG: hypothetical protein ACYCYO_00205 [Bacilli bacterium]
MKLYPVFQPIVDVSEGIRPIGFEALLRGRDERESQIPPCRLFAQTHAFGGVAPTGPADRTR